MHMDPKLKIALIFIAFAIIAYWIVNSHNENPSSVVSTEHYSAAFDPKYIDPRVGAATYSKNISFRPDEDLASVDSTGKMFDHVDDQSLGISQYAGPDEGDYNRFGPNDVMKKQVRFAEPSIKYVENSLPPVRNVNWSTSYQETDIDVDRVNESNNIHNYCIHGNNKKTSSCCGNIIDSEFVDDIRGSLALSMDMSDDQYAVLMNPMDARTYVQIQEDEALGVGEYDEIGKQPVQDIKGLQEITNVINLYRNNTLDTIRGDYRGIRTISNGGSMIYDSVN